MDETKDTVQGAPLETGQPSGGDAGITSGGEPKTFTEEEKQKAVSDALAKQGREIKKLSTEHTQAVAARDAVTQELESSRSALSSLQARIDEMELTEAKGDPDMEAALRQKRTRMAQIQDLESRKKEALKTIAQAKADAETVAKDKKEIAIGRLAAKFNVEAEWLEGLGIDNVDSLTKIAESTGERTKSKKPAGDKLPITPDSGGTIGGGEPTLEQLEAMSMEDYAKRAEKRFK